MIYDAVQKLMETYTYEMYVNYMKEFKPDQVMMTKEEFEEMKKQVKEIR